MDFMKYMPENTSRIREDIEWSIHYAYNATDKISPRVLLIGDSICNGYQSFVREKLEGRMNVSFWASSKCVTDPDYFRELEFYLDYLPYTNICFNNGLHSLTTVRTEWESAYVKAIEFIRFKCSDAKLSLTLCTPLKDTALTAISAELNAFAKKQSLPVIDLFTLMDELDRNTYWTDTYHFTNEAREIQAETIAAHLL